MTPADKAFSAGLLTASQIARASAAGLLRSGAGAKSLGAHAALEQLADDLATLARPPEEPDAPPVVTVSPPPKGPLSPGTSAALGAMAQAAADHLRAPLKVLVVDTMGAPAPADSEARILAMLPVPHGVETVDVAAHRAQARAQGYTGDECRECGSFSMVRNGTCLKCENCGATTGCS